MSNEFNRLLWRRVEGFQRRPRKQRLLIRAAWVVLATTAVFLWIWIWDCPIC